MLKPVLWQRISQWFGRTPEASSQTPEASLSLTGEHSVPHNSEHPAPQLVQNPSLSSGENEVLSLQSDMQALRLTLTEREATIQTLQAELERHRRSEESRVEASVRAQLELLFAECAQPITQLFTQAYLLEVAEKPLQAKDVLGVAKRLIQAMEDQGLAIEGEVGETCIYDPERHEPMGGSNGPLIGQQVHIRFVGLAYHGRRLRKAAVEGAGG